MAGVFSESASMEMSVSQPSTPVRLNTMRPV
jgi:hypothetical protein